MAHDDHKPPTFRRRFFYTLQRNNTSRLFMKHQDVTDAEIIEKILQGGTSRESGVAILYERHMTLVIKVKRRFKMEEETALDAYTDGIIKLSRLIEQGKYRGDGKLFTLLYQIVSNLCVDILRKKTSKAVEWVDEIPIVPDDARSSLEQIIQQEDLQSVGALLDKAGERCRQVLMDALYYGFKLEEIAERNDLKNTQTVSSIKSRCLSRLRKLISDRS